MRERRRFHGLEQRLIPRRPFLACLERSVAGELFEAGDVDSCSDSREITPRRRLRPGERPRQTRRARSIAGWSVIESA
jgi:hypothetical protein